MLQPGDLAKDFDLPNFENKHVRLLERLKKNAPLFLVFYKYNCPTCQFTFPHLARLAHSLGPEHFLAVAQDTPAEAKQFRDQYRFNFDVACDMTPYPISVAYGVDYVPTAFIIEADGKISSVMEGFEKKALEAFAARINASVAAFDPAEKIPLRRPG